jgi:hypothetical protein
MIIVVLTLVGVAAPCRDAPTWQEIQEVIANSKHMIPNTCRSPSIYIQRGDLAPKQSNHKPNLIWATWWIHPKGVALA